MRALTVAMQNQLRVRTVQVVWFAELEFVDLTLYLTTRRWNMDWGGHTWLGNGILKAPRSIRQTKDSISTGLEIPLASYDDSVMALVLESINRTKKARIYFGMLDTSGALLDTPYRVFTGRYDNAHIQTDGETREITIAYENDFLLVKRVNAFRYTDQCQQGLFPGDTGFQRAPLAADWSGFWGGTTRPLINQRRKRNTAQ